MTASTLTLALLVGSLTLLLRLATFEIGNDDFLHLSVAQQILLGDVPVRDFIDPGEVLFTYTSAVAQRVFGHNVGSEVLLDMAGLSIAAALSFLLAARASGSRWWALVAAVTAVLLMPRLYAYPKLLLYPIGLAAIWAYLSQPTITRLVTVAVVTVVAFLFRHDHGACIGITMGVSLVMVHLKDGVRTVTTRATMFAASVLVLLLPFIVFVQMHGGVVSYFRYTAEIARGEYLRTVGDYPSFRAALAAPRVRVQWASDVDQATRGSLAARYRLSNETTRDDGYFEYDLDGWSPSNLAALVADARVKDTVGFDRRSFLISAPLEDPNFRAWFYYLTMAVAPVALLLCGLDVRRRGGALTGLTGQETLVVSAAVLSIVMNLFLMRSAAESAIGDVSSTTAIVAAVLLARPFARRPSVSWLAAGITLIVFAVSAFLLGRGVGGFVLSRTVYAISDEGATAITGRLNRAGRLAPPFETPVTEYVNACTRPTDRLLLTWYAPEIIYGSGRGFAGGRPYFITSFATSDAAIAYSLDVIKSQRVPLMIIGPDYESEFRRAFRSIDTHVRSNYREFEAGDLGYRVMADERLTPSGTYRDTNLPCFR